MKGQSPKTIYELFWISILIKAIGSLVEMIAGVVLALIPGTLVVHAALLLTQGDFDGDADDFLANAVVHAAHAFAVSNQWLLGAYLFVRGLIQLLLVYALFRNKLWAYPALIIVIFLFVCTQLYEIYVSHSIPTGIITILDLITIYLVAREYRIVRKALVPSGPKI